MHFITLLTSLLTLTTFASAGWLDDVVGVPTCAKTCAKSLPAACSADPTCICKNKDWMNSAQCCISQQCSASDVLITQQFAAQLCHYVGQPVQTPTNCPKPTTVQSVAPTPTVPVLGYGQLLSYKYLGCYKPDGNNVVIYGVSYLDEAKMTQEYCYGICAPGKYKYMGIGFGRRCFCGGALGDTVVKQGNDNNCQSKCTGNNKELCGGDNFVAAWQIS